MRVSALTLGLLLLALVGAGPQGPSAPDRGAPEPAREQIRGITISTHGSGRDWGTDNIVPTIRSISAVGATWVATHPYARIRRDGSVTFRDFDIDNPPEHLVRPIREAHELGVKIMIKPHLAYWGSPFKWRGEIEFEEPAQWQRFFADYRRWIVKLARVCGDADGFAVGTELDRTIAHEGEWRRIAREVRAVTKAPLTYAANWTDYQRVPFWDALDVIGIQAYFPLTRHRDPTVAQLQQAWRARMAELSRYARAQRRDIVFTELGYNRSHLAPIEPWQSRSDGRDALPIQLTCMRIALEAIDNEPTVLGAFLWKWFTHPNRHGGNFRLDTPEMQQTLRTAWRE